MLPGKTADDAKSIAEEFRRRPDEYAESRRRLGVTLERVYLQTTPMGMFVVASIESGADFGQTSAAVARSDLDLDQYFVRAVKELHGVDLTQPPQGEPPETVGEWVDPQVTERRRGMAFCAPLIPGTEEQGRAFCPVSSVLEKPPKWLHVRWRPGYHGYRPLAARRHSQCGAGRSLTFHRALP